jgi:hypothetical protein
MMCLDPLAPPPQRENPSPGAALSSDLPFMIVPLFEALIPSAFSSVTIDNAWPAHGSGNTGPNHEQPKQIQRQGEGCALDR